MNWLFVIIKSYAFNFKERNNNNNHCQNISQIFSVLLCSLEGHLLACFFFQPTILFLLPVNFFWFLNKPNYCNAQHWVAVATKECVLGKIH